MTSRPWPARAALLGALLGAATAQAPLPLSCDTAQELGTNLEYLRTVCGQAGEAFDPDDPFDPVPQTCAKPVCALAVQRVAEDCGELLQYGWFATWNRRLTAAVAECALVPQPPSLVAVAWRCRCRS